QGEGEPAQQPPGHLVGQHPAQGQGGQGKYEIGQRGQNRTYTGGPGGHAHPGVVHRQGGGQSHPAQQALPGGGGILLSGLSQTPQPVQHEPQPDPRQHQPPQGSGKAAAQGG